MAVIKIISIKSNLQAVINYAMNGEKTKNGILVSGINCIPKNAYHQMQLTKRFYHKENKTLGFHIIQSFSGDEVTPEGANEIGQELARELFGDRFQFIVCTHVNKQNIHNHIVINSVSFIDGKKYHNSNAEIALLKDTSDAICSKYDLSTIDTDKSTKEKEFRDKRVNFYYRNDTKMIKIKNDIDEAIFKSENFDSFRIELQSKDYELFTSGKYFTIKSPYFNRKIRLERAFGENYSYKNINLRLSQEKSKIPVFISHKKYYKRIYTGETIDKLRLKYSDFYRCYVHWMFILGKLPPKNQYVELTPEYFKQKKENEQIFNELNFIVRKHFESCKNVDEYKKSSQIGIANLKESRESIYRHLKVSNDKDYISNCENQIRIISQEIKKKCNEVKICTHILKHFGDFKLESMNLQKQENKKDKLISEMKKERRKDRER